MSRMIRLILESLRKKMPDGSVVKWQNGTTENLDDAIVRFPGPDSHNQLVDEPEKQDSDYVIIDPATRKVICTVSPPDDEDA